MQTYMDLLLTDAFLLYSSHLLHGKVDPVKIHPEWNILKKEGDPVVLLKEYLESGDIEKWYSSIQPQNLYYKSLKEALNKYTEIKNNGGWPVIPAGESLKPGMKDPRVIILKERLKITGEYSWEINDDFYDDKLENFVNEFQKRHGLEEDGKIGKYTLYELNVGVDDRIDQIIVNMERLRWLPKEFEDNYIFVNIASFELKIYKRGKVDFKSVVIVGKPARETPVFSSSLSYLVFNPTWTIPPTILKNDILPAQKNNPNYLASKNIKIYDNNDRLIDNNQVDWQNISISNFPYILRQDAGPDNALGSVKLRMCIFVM